ncbi:peptidoglycan-binding protein [Cytobacillus kochii]|uniref:peptidoglycan-binding protein n=1 Tax=Cytobacillus kochii TaxID=859143 RepID=UPI002784B0A0|nr:peptidoglycan-binding protein [Cytobacillus kochii]MDQ0186650.1 peptidoglycan hydrolase-like protein with peptidoglycan-binding domain [Cytobacillus kochii]
MDINVPIKLDMLRTAANEIGTLEGHNNDTKYGESLGMNRLPWCASFVSWCAAKSGNSDLFARSASVATHKNYNQNRNQFYDESLFLFTIENRDPDIVNKVVGGLIFFHDGNIWSHIGLIERYDHRNRMFTTIEGNTWPASPLVSSSHGVFRRYRYMNSSDFAGVAVVNYDRGGNSAQTGGLVPIGLPYDSTGSSSFPGTRYFYIGAYNNYVTLLGKMLVKAGYGSYYSVGPGPKFTATDQQACAAFQRAQGWSGSDADGIPGPSTWSRLSNIYGTGNTYPQQSFPGTQFFRIGASNQYVTMLGVQLVKAGYGRHYSVGPGPNWGEADRLNCQEFQRAQGWSGSDADGYPGPSTWQRLFQIAGSAPNITVFPGAHFFGNGANNEYVTAMGKKLIQKGYSRFYTVGAGPKWSDADRQACAAFQRAQGWSGSEADGYPGPSTWTRLFM